MKILIAHAESEVDLAEQLATPLREAGYGVAHRGNVLVGESVVQEASKLLIAGSPIVLCGTVKAIGTGWAHRLVNAARLNSSVRVYAVQMDQDAYLDALALDAVVANYWQNPDLAISQLLETLRRHYPLAITDTTASNTISIDTLRANTSRYTRDQIRIAGRERYIPELYVPRELVAAISEFVAAESVLRARSSTILDRLQRIAEERQPYRSALASITDARRAFEELDPSDLDRSLTELKRSFEFALVTKITTAISQAVQITVVSEFDLILRQIVEYLKRLPGEHDEGELVAVREAIASAARVHLSSAGLTDPSARIDAVWSILPSESSPDHQCETASALIEELDRARRILDFQCLAIVGPAGCGKTSLLCATAEQLLPTHPVVFVPARHAASGETSILNAVVSATTGATNGTASAIAQVSDIARSADSWIYVVIDGVNESSNPAALSRAVARFLALTVGMRFRMILSCRDVSWPLCAAQVGPHLPDTAPLHLTAFSDAEWSNALGGYQEKYRTRLSLSDEAERTLRHPLLLRLFFESHPNDFLGHVSDLRRLGLFSRYLQAALDRVAARRGLLRPETARQLLLAVATQMTSNRRDFVRVAETSLNHQDLEDPESNYNALRSEGLLEDIEDAELGRCIRFTFSELAEYLVALGWQERLHGAPHLGRAAILDEIVRSSVEALPEFELVSGALVLFDELIGKSGQVLNRCVCEAMAGPPAVRRNVLLAIAQMLDHLPAEAVTDETFDALTRLESEGGPDVKQALVPAALRLLDAHSSNPRARSIGAKILGIDADIVPSMSGELEHRYRHHIEAHEANERMIGDKDFQKEYFLRPEVRDRSRFAFRFRSQAFVSDLFRRPEHAERAFSDGASLHPVGWQELLTIYREWPVFAAAFDEDSEFREACLEDPEGVYRFYSAEDSRWTYDPGIQRDDAGYWGDPSYPYRRETEQPPASQASKKRPRRAQDNAFASQKDRDVGRFRASRLYRSNPRVAELFETNPGFRARCLADRASEDGPGLHRWISEYLRRSDSQRLERELGRGYHLRDDAEIRARSYDPSATSYLDYPPEDHREFEVDMKRRAATAKLRDPLFVRSYLAEFEVREVSGRLLEMQSLALRNQLFTSPEFRSTYLQSAHFREMWFRNPERAWNYRHLAADRVAPPDLTVYVRQATYRYEDSARLNALSILARNDDQDLVDLLVRGIRELKVKHAVAAFRGIDQTSDRVAVEIARRFAAVDTVEYVIFAAWLLRRRYGKAAADVLASLLCHRATRVHRYATRLFESRDVEPELFNVCIRHLEEFNVGARKNLQRWHISNLCVAIAKGLRSGLGDPETRAAVGREVERILASSESGLPEASKISRLLQRPEENSSAPAVGTPESRPAKGSVAREGLWGE